MNTSATGSAAMHDPAIRCPQSTLCSPCEYNARPTGRVRIDWLLVKMRDDDR